MKTRVVILPCLCPVFISNGVNFHCGQKMLVHDVHGADKSCVKHAPYQGNEYSGKLSMCSHNKQFWIWYCLIQAIFQAVSRCWKVHPWLILGSHTCICFSSQDVCVLPESLIPPECLLHMRLGSKQHKPQRKCTVCFYFFNLSVVVVFHLFCIFASSDVLGKKVSRIQCT